MAQTGRVPFDGTTDGQILTWDNTAGEWDTGGRDIDLGGYYIQNAGNLVENGFVDASATTISFTDGTRTASVQPTATDFDFFVQGKAFTSTGDTVVIPDTEGLHYVYFDTNGDLTSTTTFTPDIITLYAFAIAVYWDATNNVSILVGDERHGVTMDSATHSYNHNTFGARYDTGFALTVTADGDGSADAHAQIVVAGGEFWDEDIHFTIADGAPQDLTPIAQIPMYYRSGASGDWRVQAADNFPVAQAGAGERVAWNEWTGATWQLTQATNADFVLTHIFASNDISEPIIGIVGQAEHATISAAYEAANTEMQSLQTGSLDSLFPEFIPIATLIFQTGDAGGTNYTNTPHAIVVSTEGGDDYVDWRGSTATAAGGSSSSGTTWGDIQGTVANQTDLQTEIDTKLDHTAATSGDLTVKLGDAAGTNKISFTDSGDSEVAAIFSDGDITTSGTVDGVDIANHAADGDIHADHTTISITAGQGLEGGGTIAANRTLDVHSPVNAQTGTTYTAIASDQAQIIRFTGQATATLNLTAAATLGDGWFAYVRNDNSGNLTIDPDSAETIDGSSTLTLETGLAIIIFCNGSLFYTLGIAAVAGGGNVSNVPTPSDNQVAVWTGATTIEGTSGLTYAASVLDVTGNITLTGTVDTVDIQSRDSTHFNSGDSAEISVLTEKTAPTTSDHILIEDAAASNSKKRSTVGNILEARVRSFSIAVFDSDTDTATGDGKVGFCVPNDMANLDITRVTAAVHTAGTVSGTLTVQVRRRRSGADVDVLNDPTGLISIATSAYSDTASSTDINAANDDLNEGDLIYVDVDSVHGTAAKGLTVTIEAS